ncbi:response regulator transcription factor [Actinomadura litoris]|uniref:response regulator transcription factor n=1 Tax=Actinomadura litoris TaxID=2678616 RepID=UPI001FA79AE9|nr:response regulator transcription factor [Actinomadura litoris]
MSPGDLLIVEDDPEIGSDLVEILTEQGYSATWSRAGRPAARAVLHSPPQIVVVDLGLPDMDGVTLCRWLRDSVPEVAILVLTARTREPEVVMALDAGADDYVTKPFRLGELLARLRALRRRGHPRPGIGLVSVGDLRLHVAARRAFVGGAEMALRPREFDLLFALVARAGRDVSRDELMREVWGANWFGATKTLDVHVCALRRRLSAHGHDPGRISTVRGHGYRYEII